MSRGAWGHAVVPIVLEAIVGARSVIVQMGLGPSGAPHYVRSPECSRRRCGSAPLYWATYNYVTGRRGRTSTRTALLCRDHAAAFAEKHLDPAAIPLIPPARLTDADVLEWKRLHQVYEAYWRERATAFAQGRQP